MRWLRRSTRRSLPTLETAQRSSAFAPSSRGLPRSSTTNPPCPLLTKRSRSFPAARSPAFSGLVGAGTALAALAGPPALPGTRAGGRRHLPAGRGPGFERTARLLPLTAAPLAAVGALAAAPALVAFLGRNTRERVILGALTFAVALMSAVGFGFGDRLGIAPKAEQGWRGPQRRPDATCWGPSPTPRAWRPRPLGRGSSHARAHSSSASGSRAGGNNRLGCMPGCRPRLRGRRLPKRERRHRRRDRRLGRARDERAPSIVSEPAQPQPLASAQPALHGNG